MQVASGGARQPRAIARHREKISLGRWSQSCLFLYRGKFNDGQVNAIALNKWAAWRVQGPLRRLY